MSQHTYTLAYLTELLADIEAYILSCNANKDVLVGYAAKLCDFYHGTNPDPEFKKVIAPFIHHAMMHIDLEIKRQFGDLFASGIFADFQNLLRANLDKKMHRDPIFGVAIAGCISCRFCTLLPPHYEMTCMHAIRVNALINGTPPVIGIVVPRTRQPKLQSQTQPKLQSQTQPKLQSQTQSQTQPKSQSQTQSKSQSQTQSKSQSRTHSQTQPKSQLQTQSQTQPQPLTRRRNNPYSVTLLNMILHKS